MIMIIIMIIIIMIIITASNTNNKPMVEETKQDLLCRGFHENSTATQQGHE